MKTKKFSEYTSLSNEELVALSQEGDESAFNVLAGRFLNTRTTRTSASYLDCDDFVQEGMFGFLNAVRTFNADKGVPFEAYASVCMRNSINTAAGNVSKEIPVENTSDALLSIESTEDPLGHIITSEHLSEVLDICQITLSEIEKTVVFFKAGGMSYGEIGERLGLSPKAVDNAVQRARRKIKKVLTENG